MLLRNITANVMAGLLGPVFAILFTRFYIEKIGEVGYGVVGFFSVLTVVVQVFAQGINTTFERRIAVRLSAGSERKATQLIFGTLQRLYLVCGGLITIIIFALSGYLAGKWGGQEGIPVSEARLSIVIGGLLIALNLVSGLYASLFVGLGRQVYLSMVTIGVTVVQTVISIGLVSLNPVPSSFVTGQAVASLGGLIALGWAADREVGWRKSGLRPDLNCLKSEARLSFAVIAMEAIGVMITYADRILVAALLSKSSLAAYTVAQTGARGLGILRGPLLQAFTPVLLSWAASDEFTAIREKFWRIQMILVILVGVLAAVIIFLADPLLQVWLRNNDLAAAAAPSLSLLVAGSFLLVMSGPPYLIAVSRKYMRANLVYNCVSVFLMLGLGFFSVRHFGAAGSAAVWLAYCAGCVVVTHAGIAHLLYAGAFPEFVRDAARVLLKSMAVAAGMWLFYHGLAPIAAKIQGGEFWRVAVQCLVLCLGGASMGYVLLFGLVSPVHLSRSVSRH